MGLLTALYVYFIFVPKMLLMNFLKRFINYKPKVVEEGEFFKQSKNQEWMSNWMASNRFVKAVLRTAKIQVSSPNSINAYYHGPWTHED